MDEIIEKQRKEQRDQKNKKQKFKNGKGKKSQPMANATTMMKRLLFFKESGNKNDKALLELIAGLFREKNVRFFAFFEAFF